MAPSSVSVVIMQSLRNEDGEQLYRSVPRNSRSIESVLIRKWKFPLCCQHQNTDHVRIDAKAIEKSEVKQFPCLKTSDRKFSTIATLLAVGFAIKGESATTTHVAGNLKKFDMFDKMSAIVHSTA
jgi:hypothetical protein